MKSLVSRAYKFRLYPTPAQVAELDEWTRQLKRLWNLAHEQRLSALTRPNGERPGQRRKWLRDRAAGHARCWLRELAAKRTKTARAELRAARGLLAEARADTSVDYYRQSREATALLSVDDQLARVVCSARQEILRDLDKAWQRFWKRLGGKPHFKRRTDSARIYFSTPKHWKVEAGALHLGGIASSIGPIEILQDRPWPGDAKSSSCSIVRDVDEWYAVFPLQYSLQLEAGKKGMVGLNRGAIHAIADSDGRVVDSPAFYTKALGTIRARQADVERKRRGLPGGKRRPTRYRMLRASSASIDRLAAELGTSVGNIVYQVKKRGGIEQAIAYIRAQAPKQPSTRPTPPVLGRNAYKAAQRLARAHQLVRRQRQWWLHEQSAYYSAKYKTIAIEDMSTKKIVERPGVDAQFNWSTTCRKHECSKPVHKQRLCKVHYEEQKFIPKSAVRRSILDVGWYELGRQLEYKSGARGGTLRKVFPGPMPARQLVATEPQADAGISRQCSGCGATMQESASGNQLAYCDACLNVQLGDVNAARNNLMRAMFSEPAPKKTPRVSIKIKGRVSRSVTPANPVGEAYGGDVPSGTPVEVGIGSREGPATSARLRRTAQ